MTPLAILLTLVAYAALLYGVARIGLQQRGENHTFFTGNRTMAWWVVALGMIGAPMSGVSFVSVPGSVATDAFSYMQMVAGFTIGQLVIAYLLVPLFYRLKVTSLYEYLDRRFGETTHRTGAGLFLLSKLVLTALKLYVVCMVLQQLVGEELGIPFTVNLLFTIVLVWGYTLRGGVRSVVWTDLLQTLCLMGAVIATVWAISDHFEWSLSELIGEVASDPSSQILFTDETADSTLGLGKMFVGGLFVLIAMTGLDQDMMQRNLACRSVRDSQRNILLTAIAQGGVIYLLLVLGLLLHRYAEASQITASGDALFASVAVGGGLPTWVALLFVLGLISSTWSTAGSALTALTTSTIYDLLPHRTTGDEALLKRLRYRIHTLLALVIGVLILLFEQSSDGSVIHLLYRVVSYTYGPILGLFAFGILTNLKLRERLTPLVCLTAPLLAALLKAWLQKAGYAIGYELILYNALLTFGGLLLIHKK